MAERKRRYVRLFDNLYNVDLAIRLLNEGYTFGYVALKLRCDRTSVISFKERQERDGVVFKKFNHRKGIHQSSEDEELPEFIHPRIDNIPIEPVNLGKNSYSDYLETYQKEIRESQRIRMEEAKIVIDRVHEERKTNGIKDEPVGSIWGWV